jgi:hypothetical protein
LNNHAAISKYSTPLDGTGIGKPSLRSIATISLTFMTVSIAKLLEIIWLMSLFKTSLRFHCVVVEGEDREGMERLLRYCARPAFALERPRQIDPEHLVHESVKPGPRSPLCLGAAARPDL